jgi:site-specific recombinase XerD
MALTLYRRHKRDCTAAHPEDSRSSQLEENRKGWKRCACKIHVSGTIAGKFARKNSGTHVWEEASQIAHAWKALGKWTDEIPLITPPGLPEPKDRTTIADALKDFIAKVETKGLARATQGKYATFKKQFTAFTEDRGYRYTDQLTISDMDRFYAGWKDGKRSKARKLNKLKNFVRFCLRRKWIKEDIAIDLEPPEGSSLAAGKSPFTDDELNRILGACDQIKPIPPGPGHREWSGEDVKDFIYVMLYSGMRISDVATFDISTRLHGNEVFLRMHKTRKELFTWIPDWLVVRLRERERAWGPKIFGLSKSESLPVQTERWRLKLAKVFRLAGAFQEKAVPHRFRHTFVRILLEKGVQPSDVAELIGDTEAILRKHYSKWIKSRQTRLTNILKEAFEDKPKPKIVEIPKSA